jgi:hypothetical protein
MAQEPPFAPRRHRDNQGRSGARERHLDRGVSRSQAVFWRARSRLWGGPTDHGRASSQCVERLDDRSPATHRISDGEGRRSRTARIGQPALSGRPPPVIDGDSFAHRSYHALPKTIRRRDGKGAGAIFGFANFLLRLYGDEQPRAVTAHSGVASDQPGNLSRRGSCRWQRQARSPR